MDVVVPPVSDCNVDLEENVINPEDDCADGNIDQNNQSEDDSE